MEEVLGRRGGWIAWGLVLMTTAALGLRRAPPFEGDTLAGRLGATPGIGPGLRVPGRGHRVRGGGGTRSATP